MHHHQQLQPAVEPLRGNGAGIFTGKVRDWSEVPGAKISGPIDLFDRDGASGTQDAFQHIFLGETLKISPSATDESSNGLEENAVGADKQAIGFVSFAFTTRRQRGRLRGHRVHAAQRQVRSVPRRA